MNSESNYDVPIHFLWRKTSNSAKTISFINRNYMYNQAWCLMIATQSTDIFQAADC